MDLLFTRTISISCSPISSRYFLYNKLEIISDKPNFISYIATWTGWTTSTYEEYTFDKRSIKHEAVTWDTRTLKKKKPWDRKLYTLHAIASKDKTIYWSKWWQTNYTCQFFNWSVTFSIRMLLTFMIQSIELETNLRKSSHSRFNSPYFPGSERNEIWHKSKQN